MIQNYLELEKTYVLGVYAKKELVLVKGKNAKIWDNHGNEYIDCVSGNGVANLGHANDKNCPGSLRTSSTAHHMLKYVLQRSAGFAS